MAAGHLGFANASIDPSILAAERAGPLGAVRAQTIFDGNGRDLPVHQYRRLHNLNRVSEHVIINFDQNPKEKY